MCYHWSFCAKRCRHKYRRTRKIRVALRLRSPGMGGLAETEIHATPHMCHHVTFCWFCDIECMQKNKKEPSKLASAGTRPLLVGCG